MDVASLFTQLTLGHYLGLSVVLFAVGTVGVLLRRNAIIVLMSVELMMNAGNLAVITFARRWHDPTGHTLAMMVIAVAAAEAAIGLAIAVNVFRQSRHANIDRLTTLRH